MGNTTTAESLRKFMKTEDKDAVSIVERYKKDLEDFYAGLLKADEEYDVTFVGATDMFTGVNMVTGAKPSKGENKLPGRWTKPDKKGVMRPYESNKRGKELIASMKLADPQLPGIKPYTIESDESGRSYFCNTVFFTFGKTLWVSVGKSMDVDSPIWEETKYWEYEKAREESDEKEKGESDD